MKTHSNQANSSHKQNDSHRHVTAPALALTVLIVSFVVLARPFSAAAPTDGRPSDNNGDSPAIDRSTPEPAEKTIQQKINESGARLNAGSPARELADYAIWLDRAQAQGFIGEVGWPASAGYTAAAGDWLKVAEATEIPFTMWAAGSKWSDDYPIRYYSATDNQVIDSHSPASLELTRLIQPRHSWGVNLAGLEFGHNNTDFSAQNPGDSTNDYFAELEPSYAYLKGQGVEIIRLPITWERIQPQLNGDLNQGYLNLIKQSIAYANKYGMQTVIDLHNYGAYVRDAAEGPLLLGGYSLNAGHLSDVWRKLIVELGSSAGVYGLGLMNEPHDLPGEASTWESISQTVVDDLRRSGYQGKLIIAGYRWSSLEKWSETHPDPWIDDPAGNFAYEAHHYWDQDGSGTYDD